MADYPRIPSFKTTESFRSHLREINLDLELDDAILAAPESPLAQPVEYHGRRIGNRWCILPMEGWDCLPDGAPSELTRRRWLNFAASGAKLLFGCEACAVMESGRSNTRQLMITPATMPLLAQLRKDMVKLHAEKFGTADDLYIGLQLTHSGRYSHPHDDAKLESVTAYEHPLLDEKFHNSAANVVSDAEVKNIIRHFIEAAGLAKEAGFDFVDIKMAHGYLGHEFLSAFTRPGEYGGSFENRTRFFREIVEGIKREVPGIDLGMRFSIFDCLPFEKGADKGRQADGAQRNRRRQLQVCLRRRRHRPRLRPDRTDPVPRTGAVARRGADLHDHLQSLLQSALPASCLLSGFGRLPAAGGADHRRGPPDQRGRTIEETF